MSSILEQKPEATLREVLEAVDERQLSTRERMRVLAVVGGVPIAMLAELSKDRLADVLRNEPGEFPADPAVRIGLTMRFARNRVNAVAMLILDQLRIDRSPAEAPEPTPGPQPASSPARSTFVEPTAPARSWPGPRPRPATPAAPQLRSAHRPAPPSDEDSTPAKFAGKSSGRPKKRGKKGPRKRPMGGQPRPKE